ncbi:MAG: glycine cleavage system protein GcvH [Acidimicrobiales bacterium]
MNVPDELGYTADHEWAKSENGRIRIGITDFAQDALGDVVFVELPAPGANLVKGSALGEIESTKSVSQIYSPVSGTVVEVNAALVDAPEQVNGEPYGSGWLVVIEPSDPSELDTLLDAAAYRAATQ